MTDVVSDQDIVPKFDRSLAEMQKKSLEHNESPKMRRR